MSSTVSSKPARTWQITLSAFRDAGDGMCDQPVITMGEFSGKRRYFEGYELFDHWDYFWQSPLLRNEGNALAGVGAGFSMLGRNLAFWPLIAGGALISGSGLVVKGLSWYHILSTRGASLGIFKEEWAPAKSRSYYKMIAIDFLRVKCPCGPSKDFSGDFGALLGKIPVSDIYEPKSK